MSDPKQPTEIGRFGHDLIIRKARQLRRNPCFSQEDPQDLQQELACRLLKRLEKYDEQQGERDHFISMAVKQLVANLVRDRRTKLPRGRKVVSLFGGVDSRSGDPLPLAAAVTPDDLDARIGGRRCSPEVLAQLALDCAEILNGLSEEDLAIVEALKTKSRSEAARALGVPRTSLNDHIRRIRERFERGDMRKYL